ncbi:DNA methyltransferase, partial [Rodentibacter trehalosifermentans]|uniref:DNA methyltransferase n=1 Tax=Rodentibacter trehalosifermentans TaxID=1908263 RepID=UPI001179FD6F
LKLLCDHILGEQNRLSTHQIKVRFDNKSLNEDNDFQPVMESLFIYAKNKYNFHANKPCEEYDLSKFKWEIRELSEGNKIEIGGKKVTIFKDGEWEIKSSDFGIGKLKETWASGSIVRQSGTAAEFLSKYLIGRKNQDGLNVLYKIDNMGEDGLGFRYVTGPKKENAIRGKFYSGVPLERINEINQHGTSEKTRPISNFLDLSSDFGNIRHEGNMPFNAGKKPVKLIKGLINYHKKKDILILDFFAGSGTTGHAVAQLNKEDGGNRRYILCTNNENNICENVTYQRLKNIQDELPHNLKYFKTEFIPRFSEDDEGIKQKLMHHIKELIELEYGCEIDGVNNLFIENEDALAQYLTEELKQEARIFIAPYILLDQAQNALIHRKQARVIDIPEYYFRNELVDAGEL